MALGGPTSQSNWRWCSKCQGLWFAGDPSMPAPCPAGGDHTSSGSGNYSLMTSVPGFGESNWRWCSKCQGLWFAAGDPYTTPHLCPAAGSHVQTGSGSYMLVTPPGSGQQGAWRRCNQCQGLFYNGNSTTGTCPGASSPGVKKGGHNYKGSSEYGLTPV
jgi:hypothetical protein